jgi:hypothetical protein
MIKERKIQHSPNMCSMPWIISMGMRCCTVKSVDM